jgi:hypothetical protein
MRQGKKDKGHYWRKAVFYAYAGITLVPWLILMGIIKPAMAVESIVVKFGHHLYVWSQERESK